MSEAAFERNYYRVGTAARLSGVSTDKLRAWERRYEAIAPSRSDTGRRLYTDDDVARLQLMKALTELGDPIGVIARLDYEELRARLDRHVGGARPKQQGNETIRRVALLDPDLAVQIRENPSDLGALEFVSADSDLETYQRRLSEVAADVLVMRLEELGRDPVHAVTDCLRASTARMTLVIYSFAPARVLDRLAEHGVRLLSAPVRVSELRRTILDTLDVREATGLHETLKDIERRGIVDVGRAAPPRFFSDEQLARLNEIASSVDCECPSHLSAVIKGLVAFEAYSRDCANESPRDEDLHRSLERGTAHAREVMEQLLCRVCEHDGIAI